MSSEQLRRLRDFIKTAREIREELKIPILRELIAERIKKITEARKR